jgi:biopolymer transport protein ExbB
MSELKLLKKTCSAPSRDTSRHEFDSLPMIRPHRACLGGNVPDSYSMAPPNPIPNGLLSPLAAGGGKRRKKSIGDRNAGESGSYQAASQPRQARWGLKQLIPNVMFLALCTSSWTWAQEAPASDTNVPPPIDTTAAPAAESPPPTVNPVRADAEEINFFELLVKGGGFMIPLLFMSLIAVTFTIERMIGLRRSRMMPRSLVNALGQLGSSAGGFDPRKAYKICQQYPCAASTVVRAMLLKVGRPHSEVEHTVQETSQREAERLNANVRWLNLAAGVSPLIGLLGTVWGMIIAFHDLTILTPDQNKAEFLARGIYIALVTTLGGLMIAIPAAIGAHFFEGRIQAAFHQIDEMVFSILPQVERFEGRIRFGRQGDGDEEATSEPISPPPVAEKSTAK